MYGSRVLKEMQTGQTLSKTLHLLLPVPKFSGDRLVSCDVQHFAQPVPVSQLGLLNATSV